MKIILSKYCNGACTVYQLTEFHCYDYVISTVRLSLMLVLYMLNDSSSVIYRVGRVRVSYTRRVGGAIAYKSIYMVGMEHRLIMGRPILSDSIVQVCSYTIAILPF